MSKPPALNKDQIAKIAKSMESGKSLEACANSYRVSLPTLRNNLRRNGYHALTVSESPYHRKITPEVLDRVKQMIANGTTQAEAARLTGFTAQAICAKLNGKVRGPRNQARKPKDRPQESFKDEALKSRIEFNNRHLSTLQLRVSV
ncbi:MAG: hypothetical protein V4563_17515 [Pseudomonadota bacterium]